MLAACNLPTTATLDPSAAVTGIYTLDASTQSDTCEPQRFVGAVTVPIFATAETIVITDQSSSVIAPTLSRTTLTQAAGYAFQVPATGTTIFPCPPAQDGSFTIAYTLTAASATSLEVTEDETWTIVTPCSNTTIGASSVPAASCAASRTLDYTLVEPCAAPCTITQTTAPYVPTCTCPQGSGS